MFHSEIPSLIVTNNAQNNEKLLRIMHKTMKRVTRRVGQTLTHKTKGRATRTTLKYRVSSCERVSNSYTECDTFL